MLATRRKNKNQNPHTNSIQNWLEPHEQELNGENLNSVVAEHSKIIVPA